MHDPLSAAFMTIDGFFARSERALLSVLVMFGLVWLLFSRAERGTAMMADQVQKQLFVLGQGHVVHGQESVFVVD